MSAIVTSDRDEDWFTNSRAWSIILERAAANLDAKQLEEFKQHVNTIGVDFTLVDPLLRPKIALWLIAAVEALHDSGAEEQGWGSKGDQIHLAELISMLRRMVE